MALLEAAIAALIALIVAPSQFFYFDITPKVVILLGGTGILLLLTLRKRERPGGPRLFGMLLLAHGCSILLSTALSTHWTRSLFGSTWRNYGAAVEIAVMVFAMFLGLVDFTLSHVVQRLLAPRLS